MPANLTPDYLAAEARFRAAETTEAKLAALEDMYATIPKHKGTEKMRADIKRRISKLKDKETESKKGKHTDEFHVVKQGAGQIVLLGLTNSGKSALLNRLTAAESDEADYPYTTRKPVPGMVEYEDITFQLVDLPPISAELTEGGVISLARNADVIAVVLDCSEEVLLDHFEEIRAEMSKSRTVLIGKYTSEKEYPFGTLAKKAFIIANKIDIPGAEENLDVLNEFYSDEFEIQPVSAKTGEGLEELKHRMFESLDIIRVYTKAPGKQPDMTKPFTLKKGSTLTDFAAIVHKDFVHKLKYARAWGKDIVDGMQIGRDHVLEDGYVVELHA